MTADPTTLIERQLMLANYLSVGWPTLGIPPLPRRSCAAAVGNATEENRDESVTVGALDHGSDGLFQWRLDRLTAMKSFGDTHFKSGWQAIEPQAAFFCDECMRLYPELWADLVAGTKSLETLTADICDLYERPSAAGRVLDTRIGFAVAFLRAWTGEEAPAPPIVPAAPEKPPVALPEAPAASPDELVALSAIWASLSAYDPIARGRMVAYLVSRIGPSK